MKMTVPSLFNSVNPPDLVLVPMRVLGSFIAS
jgi:hypothetical protein